MTPTPPPGTTTTDWTEFGDRSCRSRPATIAEVADELNRLG